MTDPLHLRRLEVEAFVGEIRSLQISRTATVLVLGAFVVAIGGPFYILTFVAPHLALYAALFHIAQRRHARPDDAGLSRFVVMATALRVTLAAHACWCGLDLRAAHNLGVEGGFLILSSLILSALQAQPSRVSYLLGLAPPLLSLLFIGFFRPVADVKVGGAMLLFLTAVLTTAFRTRRAALSSLSMQADLADKNVELAQTVAAADLAEEVAGLGRWSLAIPTGEVTWSRGTHLIYGSDPSSTPSLADGMARYHPDDRALVESAVAKAMEDDAIIAFRYRLVRTDGALRHVAVKSKRIERADGGVSLIGVMQDITDQVAAAQANEASEERFRTLAEAVSDVIVSTDMTGIVTYISPGVEQATGYRADELLGRSSTLLMEPDDVPQASIPFLAALEARSSEPWSVKYRVHHRSGEIRWVHARLRVLFDRSNGLPQGVTAVVRDITEEKRAEEVLAASEARYRLLAENATDVTTRSTLDGRMTFVTPASERMLGYRPDEMVGRNAPEHMHPDDYKPVMRKLAEFFAAGPDAAPLVHRYRYRRKDGVWIWLEGSPRVIYDPDTGEAVEVQDTVRDVTARTELEAELVAAREAAEAGAQAKSDFLANMSHELRTPLNSIVGFAGLIAEAPELTAPTRRQAGLVAAASRSLVEIVNDVLDVATFEAEGVRLDPEPVELDVLLRAAADLLRGEAERKGLTLQVDVPPASAPVLADPARLRQIVMNLLGNAIKFTAAGKVSLSLSHGAGGATKIAVRDTGIGIPADRQARIFDRFAQADVSTSRKFGGTGLGLAISQTLVEAMGGTIGVHSVEGAGSTFWFTLDLPEAAVRSAFMDHVATSAGSGVGRHVLLADDNAVNRELFSALMGASGIAITAVENGAEALQAVQEARFDIVFMDVQMPVMDGLEATRAIRALPDDMPPIVALTANVLPAEIERCRAAGMIDHLAKPYTSRQVLDCLARWTTPAEAAPPDDAATPSASVIGQLEATIGAPALDTFLDRLADQLHGMAALLATEHLDPAELGPRAHSVRGLAGTLGFGEIARTYAELETACNDGGADVGETSRAARTATLSSLAAIDRRRATRAG